MWIKGCSAESFKILSKPARLACSLILLGLPFLGISAFGQAGDQAYSDKEAQKQTPVSTTKQETDEETGSAIRLGGAGFNYHPSDVHVDPEKVEGHHSQGGKEKKSKRVEFAGTPIPIINPTIGNGIGGVAMIAVRLNPTDTVTPASVFGGGVGFTDNGTYIYGFATKLYLKRDLFRITGAIGDGNLHYKFYGTGSERGQGGNYLPLKQEAFAFLIEPKVRLAKNWYIGPRYHLVKNSLSLDRDALEGELPPQDPPVPERDFKVQSAALGVRLEWDTRDSQFYPYKGLLLDTTVDFYESAFGSDRKYQSVEVAFQGYVGFKRKNVIAYRGAVCSSTGDPPFYDLCLLGQSKDIRGYAIGQYQDNRMLVGQVEYRRELFWRIGAVAYIGAGEVSPSFSEFNTKNILPGGGIGARFTLAKQNKINLRVDYSWGKESTAFYIGLLEAF